MHERIYDWDGVYHFAPFAADASLEPVSPAFAAHLIARWMTEEPHRTMVRRILSEQVLPAACGVDVSDAQLRDLVSLWLEAGPLMLFRETDSPAAHELGAVQTAGGAADAGAAAEPAPPPEPQIRPCDFATIVLKCKHMPDATGGKRTMTDARFWRDGGLDKNNLPPPAGGAAPSSVIEVVGYHLDRGADEIKVALEGGPGYTCGRNHPKIRIVDSATREEQVFEGQTSATFLAKCKALPPPPAARTDAFALLKYYFFPDQGLNHYSIDVEACGLLSDGRTGFGRSQHRVRVYPKDKYKVSLSIPSLKTMQHQRGRATLADGTVESSRSTKTTSRNPLTGATESSARSESVSDKRIQQTDSYSFADRQGGLSETRKTSLDASNNLTTSDKLANVDPVQHPAAAVAATFTFEREGQDIKGTETIGQFINALVNIQNEIQSVMNFIRDFQPQVGWKFVFELELFKGNLSFEWGYKEWKDHTVYPWWSFEIGMTLFALKLELRFGAELKVARVGVSVLVFGNTSIDAKVSARKEASPADSSPWELVLKSEPKGELGIRAALGSDWVKAEGKLTCGFPFEAACKCSTREPFHIDWKLNFTGVRANVTGSVRFVGSIQRDWTVIKPRKPFRTGRFPGGDPAALPLKGQHGAAGG